MSGKIMRYRNRYYAHQYIKYYEKLPLDENMIFLESQHGSEFGGNIYFIIKELIQNNAYNSFKICLSVLEEKREAAESFYHGKGLDGVRFISRDSKEYYRTAATAKHLVNDNTFLPFFIKKEGQIYLNTWHGTPLKTLGKRISNDMQSIGNAQRNMFMSDYLLYPNEYTMKHMTEDYMLENLCQNTILLDGYPRNSAFFDESLKEEIGERYDLTDKQIIAYMPTWRGTLGKQNTGINEANLRFIFEEMEERLSDKQLFYVNLHPIDKSKVNFTQYRKVRPFPNEYETYEFLNAADILITDYSSVLFDFANTGKKIILYAYDRDFYSADRGLYIPLDELPFPKVKKIRDLVNEINLPKNYDDKEFLTRFCPFDDAQTSARLCRRVFLQQPSGITEKAVSDNKKENVLLYAGVLGNSGLTASLKNLLSYVDRSKRNYFLFVGKDAAEKNTDQLKEFSKIAGYYVMSGKMNLTLSQRFMQILFNINLFSTENLMKWIEKAYKYEIRRLFDGMRIDSVIQFTGYGNEMIRLFSQFNINKIIYVHSDMEQEIKERGIVRRDVLKYAYKNYDKVAAVTKDIIPPTAAISGMSDNIRIVRNVIDYKSVINKAEEAVDPGQAAVIIPDGQRLQKILDSGSKKFINVGRFSPEKGQIRLLDAFARVHQKCPNTDLIIMGGHSFENYHLKVAQHVADLGLKEYVTLIINLPNPFPVLKRCDYFVLSSFYEGFGLVIAEADILGKPVISTDIPGPRTFMQENGGTLVENSVDGLYEGMMRQLKGEIKPMNVDYRKYNEKALQEFDALLS